VDAIDAQEAFRRGIRGVAFAPNTAFTSLAEIEAAFTGGGPNEMLLLGLTRVPGLGEPRAAYETGRALRMIIRLFDQAGAPENVGRQFIENLGGAIMVSHMRRSRPWGAADTVDMFVEMYSRILGGRRSELERVRRAVMDYAVAEPTPAKRTGGLVGMLRRKRAVGAGS
jgi:hypothetical protein